MQMNCCSLCRPRSRSRDSGDENDNIQERHFRPHFLQAPGDLIVQEGRLCRMDCKVNTGLSYSWGTTRTDMRVQRDDRGREGQCVAMEWLQHFPRESVIYWLGLRDLWQLKFTVFFGLAIFITQWLITGKRFIEEVIRVFGQLWDSAVYWGPFLKLKRRKDKLYTMFFGMVWHVRLL